MSPNNSSFPGSAGRCGPPLRRAVSFLGGVLLRVAIHFAPPGIRHRGIGAVKNIGRNGASCAAAWRPPARSSGPDASLPVAAGGPLWPCCTSWDMESRQIEASYPEENSPALQARWFTAGTSLTQWRVAKPLSFPPPQNATWRLVAMPTCSLVAVPICSLVRRLSGSQRWRRRCGQ